MFGGRILDGPLINKLTTGRVGPLAEACNLSQQAACGTFRRSSMPRTHAIIIVGASILGCSRLRVFLFGETSSYVEEGITKSELLRPSKLALLLPVMSPATTITSTDAQDVALGERLVAGAALVRRAVRKQIVDGHADDGEEEDDQAPDEFLYGRTG